MKKIAILFAILILASLACQLPSRAAPTEQPTVPVSTEAAGEAESVLATAAAELRASGKVSVTLTETQLTSYIAQRIAAQPDSPIQDPQVILQNGEIEITGKAKVGILSANASIILEPYADNGNLRVNIRGAKFGSVPVPDATIESLSQTLNQNLNDLITIQGEKFYLETIAIADGTLTLSGTLQK
ncbi:MAG TPA: hypothetical protein PJ988_00740 [Anaerolinea sp.]|nr:hypothetical protein [Anaerolinea sp.]